jgi:hypothetical protein
MLSWPKLFYFIISELAVTLGISRPHGMTHRVLDILTTCDEFLANAVIDPSCIPFITCGFRFVISPSLPGADSGFVYQRILVGVNCLVEPVYLVVTQPAAYGSYLSGFLNSVKADTRASSASGANTILPPHNGPF